MLLGLENQKILERICLDRMMFLPAARIVRAGLPVPKRIGAKLQAAQEWRRFDAGTLKSLVLLGEPGEPSKSRPKIKK